MLPSPADLRSRLEACMLVDQPRLRARLHALEGRSRGLGDPATEVLELAAQIERSLARREDRARRLPLPVFPGELPVVEKRGLIAEAIARHQVVVLCGETGSGKTTQLPKICLEIGRGVAGLIGHTQPRRIAARSVAARIAEELGSALGGAVGYKVRFNDRVSEQTYVKLMTDGILLAETQGDRDLRQYDTLIIDEAHERSLNIDFLLGYLKQLLPRRPDLKVIVTSATIDPRSFSDHFGGPERCPVIEVSGRTYPVEVRYRPIGVRTDNPRDEEPDLESAIIDAVDELASESGGEGGKGDILIFLSGEREIRETAEALGKHRGRGIGEILPLYARLSNEEQNRVFQAHPRRRIVLSTNVAETSLTVPGIKYVIDTGEARISRYSPRLKVQRLPIEAISRASARQRSGRCGRVSAGICVRLYDEQDFLTRAEFTDPEILRTNLASVILQMKSLNLGKIEDFPFLLRPDSALIRDGYDTLRELGAVDERDELTPIGTKLARLPLDPRLGRMVVEADVNRCLTEVLIIAAALSVQDPRERPLDQQDAADAAHEFWRDKDSDFLSLLKLFRAFQGQRDDLSHGKLRRWCKERFVSYTRMREWSDIHQQVRSMVEELDLRLNDRPAAYEPLHRALLTGLLSNIAKKPESSGGYPGEYDGPRGMKVAIHPGSSLFRSGAKWIIAGELVKTTKLYARTVAKIRPEWLEQPAAHMVVRTYTEPHWAPETAQVNAFETVTLFGLEIVRKRRVHYGPIDPVASRALFIQHALVQGEYLTSGAFFNHNVALEKRVRSMEDKARTRDIFADVTQRFRFYDQRVGPGVFTGPMFEAWRRTAEARRPELLMMTPEDAMQPGAVAPAPERFPDAAVVEALRVPLAYKLDQASPDDGITSVVKLEDVYELEAAPFEWLVPGRLPDKVAALVKTLPKNLRTSLGAARQVAERACAEMAFGDGDLMETLAGVLRRQTGLAVSASDFRPEVVDPHLKMHFRVLDGSGREVAEGRDLGAIQVELRKRLARAVAGLPPGKFNRKPITIWDLGDLPEFMDVRHMGESIRVYPALTDEGGEVGVRPFEGAARAREAMRFGLTRLMMLQVRGQIRSLITTTPGIERLMLLHAELGSGERLVEDLTEVTAWRAFFGDDAAVRTKEAFEARLDAGWGRLGGAGREVFELAEGILTARQRVCARLAGLPPAAAVTRADVGLQLSLLFPRGVLAKTSWRWLTQYPRFLMGIERRLEKVGGDGIARDAKKVGEVTRFFRALVETAGPALVGGGGGGGKASGGLLPAMAEFRWMVEEYRVSVFAQELRTSVPVSAKRLERLWARAESEALVARVLG